MKTISTYLQTIENENTRKATGVSLYKLQKFCELKNKTMQTLDKSDMKEFLKNNYSGAIVSSVYSNISRLRKALAYFNNESCLEDIDLDFVSSVLSPKRDRLYTPYEITENIEQLLNAQDRCLILFCYLGLYDSNFETIRNLKETDLKGDTLYLSDNRTIKLNDYCLDIVKSAMKETVYIPYFPNARGEYVEHYLKSNTSHIIRGIDSSKTRDVVSAILLKKRINTFADFLGDKDFTPIAIKNSKTVYDFINKEYKENDNKDINQLELIDYCKKNNIVGCIEHLNVIKKTMRESIVEEIAADLDFICR